MARIVLAWELGAGFGHLVPLVLLARAFSACGHNVSLILPDPACEAPLPALQPFERIAAPARFQSIEPRPLSLSYADNLRRNGYGDAAHLRTTLAGWRQLLHAQRPDLLLVDHAPAALLASRDAPYPRAASGVGFALPPLRTPMPSLQPWLPIPEATLRQREQDLLDALNPALDDLHIEPLTRVADLFEGCQRFLCTTPEMDHYEGRSDESWWGPLEDAGTQTRLHSAAGEAPIFVYLNSSNGFLRPVLEHLVARAVPTWVYVRIDTDDWEPPAGPNLHYLTQRIDLDALAHRCRAAITQGGLGSTWCFLRRAVPVLVCPLQLEQSLLGFRLQERGLADSLSLFHRPDQVPDKVDRLLEPGTTSGALRAFVERYDGYRSDESAARIAASCLTLL